MSSLRRRKKRMHGETELVQATEDEANMVVHNMFKALLLRSNGKLEFTDREIQAARQCGDAVSVTPAEDGWVVQMLPPVGRGS